MRLSRETLSSHLRCGTRRRLTRARAKSRPCLRISRTFTQGKPVARPACVMRPPRLSGETARQPGASELQGFQLHAKDWVHIFATTCSGRGRGRTADRDLIVATTRALLGATTSSGRAEWDHWDVSCNHFPPFPTSLPCATATNCMRPLLVAVVDSVLPTSKGSQKRRPRHSNPHGWQNPVVSSPWHARSSSGRREAHVACPRPERQR